MAAFQPFEELAMAPTPGAVAINLSLAAEAKINGVLNLNSFRGKGGARPPFHATSRTGVRCERLR
jgi:hypothetical protein